MAVSKSGLHVRLIWLHWTFTCRDTWYKIVYATISQTLQDLKGRIKDACANLSHSMIHVCNLTFKRGSKCELQLTVRNLNISNKGIIVITSYFFLSQIVLSRHSVGNHGKTNARFNHSILHINVHKISFRTNSMMLYNFVNHYFSLFHSVFEIGILTPKFSTRWRRRWCQSVAHGYFNIPRHHFYEYSSSRSEVKRVARDFSGHTVYIFQA